MRSILRCVALAAVLGIVCVSNIKAEEKAVPLDKLPKVVTDAVKKMFPKANMVEATQEEVEGKIEYEVIIKENGKKIDVTVEADGKIDSLEKEIDLKDLPKAVTEALKKSYPKTVAKSAEAVYEIEDGTEEFEYYEVLLKTPDDNEIEAKFKADGTVVKDDDKVEEAKDKK
jgi:DNA-binding NtrC family response regulator